MADSRVFRVAAAEPRPVFLRGTTRARVRSNGVAGQPWGSLRPLTRHVHVCRNRTRTASDCAAGVESRRFVNVYDAGPPAVGDRRCRRRRYRRVAAAAAAVATATHWFFLLRGGEGDLVPLTGTAVVRRTERRLGQTALDRQNVRLVLGKKARPLRDSRNRLRVAFAGFRV